MNAPVKKPSSGVDLLAALRPSDDLRVEGEQDGRQVRRRVAVGDRAADRAAVADLDVADVRQRVADQPVVAGRRLRQLGVGRRAPRSPAGRRRSWRTPRSSASRPMSTSRFGLASRSFISGRRLSRRRSPSSRASPTRPSASSSEARPLVVERARDHARPPFADWIARHTVWAVNGMSRCWMPSGASASLTAFATAAVDAMRRPRRRP